MSIIRGAFRPQSSAGNTTDLINPALWLRDWAGVRRTASGETVTPQRAMGLSAYYASVRNISEDLAKLPGQLRRRRSDGRGSDAANDHPAYRIFHTQFNPIMSAFQGRRLLIARALGKGNGIGEIVRNDSGHVTQVWPIATERVSPPRLVDGGLDLEYDIRGPDGTKQLRSRDVLHIRMGGDGFWGQSIARLGAESLGTGLAAQRFSGAYYGEGLSKRLVAFVKEKLSKGGRKGLMRRLQAASAEEVGTRKIKIIPADVSIEDVGISPHEALNIERERFTVEDVARWFRMALSKLQVEQRAKGWSTYEGENTAYATDALGGWAVQIEQENAMKLLLPEEIDEFFFRHNFGKLVQADFQTQTDGIVKQVGMGLLTPNEGRDLLDRNPATLEDGKTLDPRADILYIQSAYMPLGQVGKQESEPPASDPSEPEQDPDADPDVGDGLAESFRASAAAVLPVFRDAANRIARKGSNRVSAGRKRHAGNDAAFAEWAENFYAAHGEELGAALQPAVDAVWMLSQFHGLGASAVPATALCPAEVEALYDSPADTEERAVQLANRVFESTVAGVVRAMEALNA